MPRNVETEARVRETFELLKAAHPELRASLTEVQPAFEQAAREAEVATLRAMKAKIQHRADQYVYRAGAGPTFFVLQAILKDIDTDIAAREAGQP